MIPNNKERDDENNGNKEDNHEAITKDIPISTTIASPPQENSTRIHQQQYSTN